MREDESSHKGIDRATQIEKAIIDSNDYRRIFDNATKNSAVNKTLYNSAKKMLYNRSGSHYETMYWIDGDTGKILALFDSMGRDPALTGESHRSKVEYNESLLHKLKGHNNIVVIHNHPNSSAPSAGDFNSAYKHGYSIGFVAAHNGRVFKYSSGQPIGDYTYDIIWQKYYNRGFNEIDAQIMAIEEMTYEANITFEEVLSK